MKFGCFKKIIDLSNVDIETILVSDGKNKETDEKYFIEYKKGEKIKPFVFKLP